MVVREWAGRINSARPKGIPIRDWSQRQFRFAGRGRAVTMGSIDKYILRTALASVALIPDRLAGALRISRALERTLGGIDPMTGHGWMIPMILGLDSRMFPAFAIGESNARLPRLLGRPVTA